MISVISVISVPHTGTNFTVKLLSDALNPVQAINGPILVKGEHLEARRFEGHIEAGLFPGLNIIQQHVQGNNPLYTTKWAQLFAMMGPAVIPIRDPLLSLLSALERNDTIDRAPQLDAFANLADAFYHYNNLSNYEPLFYAVDLTAKLPTAAERYGVLRKIIWEINGWYDRNLDINYEAVNKLATEWPYVNSRGSYLTKKLQEDGDVKGLQKVVGSYWPKLRQIEPKVRPLLEQLGYEKLLWWS